MKITNYKNVGTKEVWNLTVEHSNHNYVLPNGLVSKNSHSVAYSLITYATAYLKANYTIQFFTALMSIKSQEATPEVWQEKVSQYIEELKYFNIKVCPPDINVSESGFFSKDNTIYFGLSGIKTIAKSSVDSIVKAREKGKFKDIYDFLERVNKSKLNTGKFEALVKAGCFDKLGYKRQDLLDNTKSLYEYFEKEKEYKERLIEYKEREEIRKRILEARDKGEKTEKLPTALKLIMEPVKPLINQHEKIKISIKEIQTQAEFIGCYLGFHPTDLVKGEYTDIKKLWIGEAQWLRGIIKSVKKIRTKKGDEMAFVSVEDSSGKCDITIFSNLFKKIENILEVNNLIKAKVSVESEAPIKTKAIIIDVIDI